ncbi:exopolysaccharide biosynthesis polyprenyl glycosylphosphotransferase [Terricaulis sp.]|uniref:exopolysaccharide biosynthesis polyprenyl glycosylphosphotransferase n=1 Tax=Terricaulis sp. TaxID=2768686 RepID=UPI003784BF02
MWHTALQLAGAELEHIGDDQAPPSASNETDAVDTGSESVPQIDDDARRLELETAFLAMFGVKEASAETAFVTETPGPTPANDARAFPDLARRGVHIEPHLAIGFIQAVDWLVVAAVAQLAALWGAGGALTDLSLGDAAGFVLSALALKAGMWVTESYRTSPAHMRPERGAGGLALGAILGLVVANVLAPDARSAGALAAILPLAAIVLAGIHAAFAVWIRALHRKGVFSETVVLIGATEAAARLVAHADKSGDVRIVAVVDDRLARAPSAVSGAPVGGDLDALLAWEGLPHVDRIVITVTQKAEARVRAIIERLRAVPNRVDLLLIDQTESVRGKRIDKLTGAAVACVSGRPRNARRALIKRAQDIVIGSALLAFFALPMLVIAALIKLDSRGPVIYRQRRHGFNNRIITILKFRTMRHDPGAPLKQVAKADPRITKIGRFLRRTSLDELPQLFNVLGGSMSLVGPRPHAVGMKAADRDLAHIVAEYAHRHRVKPGITGWAQVNGSRGPIETPALVRHRVKLDLAYVSTASLWLDLKILARTAPALLGDAKRTR